MSVLLCGVVGWVGRRGALCAFAVEHDRWRNGVKAVKSIDRELVGTADVDVADGAAGVADHVVVVVGVRVEPRGPAPTDTCSISPIATRSFIVWYTVRNEMPGISCDARSNSDSAVGCVSLLCSSRNSSCRCGVIFKPRARNASVS